MPFHKEHMQVAVDVAMNTGALATMEYTGVTDRIASSVGTGNSLSRAVASSIVAQTAKFGSNLAYKFSNGMLMAPTPIGGIEEVGLNLVLDTASLWSLDQFNLLGMLNRYIGDENLLSHTFKQALIVESADMVSHLIKNSGLLSSIETSVRSFL